jgi:hypothetical protein
MLRKKVRRDGIRGIYTSSYGTRMYRSVVRFKVLSVLAHYAAYLSTYSSFMSFWKTHNIGRDYNTFNLTNQNAQHQHYFPWIGFWQRQKRGTH